MKAFSETVYMIHERCFLFSPNYHLRAERQKGGNIMNNNNYSDILKELAKENIFHDDLRASKSEIDDYNRQEELEAMYRRF